MPIFYILCKIASKKDQYASKKQSILFQSSDLFIKFLQEIYCNASSQPTLVKNVKRAIDRLKYQNKFLQSIFGLRTSASIVNQIWQHCSQQYCFIFSIILQLSFFEKNQMGPSLQKQQQAALDGRGKLRLNIKMSPEELQSLEGIVKERSQFKFPYICTVERLIKQEDSTNLFCQSFNHVVIQYESFDYLLSEVSKNQPLPQIQIEKIIFSICSALTFLHQQRYCHGDIQPKLICYFRGEWKLLDNYFIKGGVSAYQKILEGEQGFISPAQMEKIRHGFVRQSPPIQESDEIFGLGMTCLQLMTARPSTLCYKQSYIRFNEKNMNQAIALAQSRYPQYFLNLVVGMINMNEDKRVSIKDIMSQPFISRHSKKFSLRTSHQV